MECTVHISGVGLITIRLLASSKLFPWKAVDFSLAFLSSSISIYQASQSQPYRVCQTWLLRKPREAHKQGKSPMCSVTTAESKVRSVHRGMSHLPANSRLAIMAHPH